MLREFKKDFDNLPDDFQFTKASPCGLLILL